MVAADAGLPERRVHRLRRPAGKRAHRLETLQLWGWLLHLHLHLYLLLLLLLLRTDPRREGCTLAHHQTLSGAPRCSAVLHRSLPPRDLRAAGRHHHPLL